MKKYIRTALNFSEGKNKDVIEEVSKPFINVPGVKFIGIYPDADFNRTVIEAVGEPEPMKKAILETAEAAVRLIDMNKHKGGHPRIGALDYVPIIPIRNITIEECMEFVDILGNEIYEKLNFPVYFSGICARNKEREEIPFIRKGQYEGLKEVAHTDERKPDIGEAKLHPTAGAVILSTAERYLTAYNVILGTDDVSFAKDIANAIRGTKGGLTTIRAVGLPYVERGQVCVSMNMWDYDLTPIHRAFELIKSEATRYGVNVVGSEVIGVIDQEALIAAAEFYLRIENFERKQIIENQVAELEF